MHTTAPLPQHRTTRRRARRRIGIAAATAALLVASGCTQEWGAGRWNAVLPALDEVVELRAAGDCAELSDAAEAVQRAAESTVPGEGLIDRVFGGGGEDEAVASADGANESAAAPSGAERGTVIGTNNQEVGVEEADLVTTDGQRIVSVVDGVLRVALLDGTPQVDGTVDLTARGATTMFLRDDSALVLGTTYGGVGMGGDVPMGGAIEDGPIEDGAIEDRPAVDPPAVDAAIAPFDVTTTLTLVSLADPARPTVSATAEVEGSLVTARELDGRARVVVQSNPVMAMEGDGAELLPRASVAGSAEPLGGCADVLLATAPAPVPGGGGGGPAPTLGTVSVLTVGDDLGDLAPVSVQGAVSTVYASTEALFVAEASWDESGSRTNVHRFSLTGDGPATYTGSGRLPGHLLDQFSMSERDGALRAVTTLDNDRGARLTVLDTDGALDEIGNVGGMGIGEQVQSVRFLEDLAYLVTFRQVDPLYAVDLADPRAPRLLGELKIPGFSEYLHPVGEGLLLGVGREVDPGTGVDEGLKISLFDVRDSGALSELDQIVIPQAWSAVSSDHLAFLWDPTRRQAVIPVEQGSGAALVVRADANGLSEVGRFSHRVDGGIDVAPLRSRVVGNDLWTVSSYGLGRTDADDPNGADLLRF